MPGFAVNTKILMFDGTSNAVQDMEIGDKIMGPNAKAKIVTKITKKNGKMYEVIPVKGLPYRVPGDHILYLKATTGGMISWIEKEETFRVRWLKNFKIRSKFFSVTNYDSKKNALKEAQQFLENDAEKIDGYTKYGCIIRISINEFVNLPKSIQRLYKGFSCGLDFDENNIGVDPYALGYWLGDGYSSCTGITTAEQEVVEYFEQFASENNLVFKKIGGSKYGYYVTSGKFTGGYGKNSFLNFLKKYDLLYNKHIPDDYKFNSRENRLKLLAGLIDSDGHNAGNVYDFVFKSEKLADDVIFLARSLGFKAFKTKCQKTCTNSSRGRVTGTYYRFQIYGDGLEEIPCLLKRKQCHKRQQIKNASVTGLTIKFVGKQDYYVIETTGTGLFLEDFTVVHK